jgi:phenylacetic acid degradation operon negative regulatory protein
MKPTFFHHPDFCPTVARRHLALEMLGMLDAAAGVLVTRGRSLTWNSSYPSRAAYNSAVYRLRKQGLIASRKKGGRQPVLRITGAGTHRLPDAFRPQRWWDRRWNGIWYVLVYDVPEVERSYRGALREFLKRKRMGCLQGSVWVCPHDIRADYSDLNEAAALSDYAFLFESRTVLGQPSSDVVHAAWKMDRVFAVQRWFQDMCARNQQRMVSEELDAATLTDMAAEEMAAYAKAMEHDPLLPRQLWPAYYQGEVAYKAHRAFLQAVARRL